MRAGEASSGIDFTAIPLSDLLNPNATTTDVLRDIDATFPQLRSSSERMKSFADKVRSHVDASKPYMIPARYDKPTSSSTVGDEAWEADVADSTLR